MHLIHTLQMCECANSTLARKAGEPKPLIVPAFGTTLFPPFFLATHPMEVVNLLFGVQNLTFGFQSTPTFVGHGFQQKPIGKHHGGSKVAPYTTTNETDGVGSVNLLSISAIPEYKES